jgi:ATP-dependent DNA ligase
MKEERFNLKLDGKKLYLLLLRMENAVIAFFYEDIAKLGTVAVSLTRLDIKEPGPSSTILGERYRIVARAIAEKLASKTNKIALVSFYVDMPDAEAMKAAVKLVEKIK